MIERFRDQAVRAGSANTQIMCLGSLSPCQAVMKMARKGSFTDLDEKDVPSEERCGMMCDDGLRRFGGRTVLCRGTEVMVEGWLATVLRIDGEAVSIRYTTSKAEETVNLTRVKALRQEDLFSKDMQRLTASVRRGWSAMVSDFQRCFLSDPASSVHAPRHSQYNRRLATAACA